MRGGGGEMGWPQYVMFCSVFVGWVIGSYSKCNSPNHINSRIEVDRRKKAKLELHSLFSVIILKDRK